MVDSGYRDQVVGSRYQVLGIRCWVLGERHTKADIFPITYSEKPENSNNL